MSEEELEARWRAGDVDGVATLAIETWGGELYGFLLATMRSETAADDVFAETCEDLWRGFARFEWRCSLRTWLYTLARHAAHRYRRAPVNRASRRVSMSRVRDVEHAVRSRTADYLRSEVKDRFAEIRAALDPDDQALLILRVDRQMAWRDIARIFAEQTEGADAVALDDETVRRHAARLRKRFQRVKDEVRSRAVAAGLMEAS